MDFLDSLVLGILQGITEFLPVSSSGHLIIGEKLLGLDTTTLKSFDVMVHMGTLLAIFVYFRKDILGIMLEFLRLFTGKFRVSSEYGRLIVFIILASLPAIFAGLFFGKQIDAVFRNINIVAWMMIIVGAVFFAGEYFYRRGIAQRGGRYKELGFAGALIIGLAQAVALIPGVSRSGSTIVAGLFHGVEREKAARFSFLLGIPAIAGAGVLTFATIGDVASNTVVNFSGDVGGNIGSTISVVGSADNIVGVTEMAGNVPAGTAILFIGFISSFLAGLLSVYLLMKFLKNHSLAVFGVYRIVIGIIVLAWIG
ncbi:undecaprenyl-diphosphate phosphatase [Candidatus Peregrinibacteria bacterium]|nr:undecaprenyl-diphosphate phosphatase [Candidatus Peregrinibacteria bacterium]